MNHLSNGIIAKLHPYGCEFGTMRVNHLKSYVLRSPISCRYQLTVDSTNQAAFKSAFQFLVSLPPSSPSSPLSLALDHCFAAISRTLARTETA